MKLQDQYPYDETLLGLQDYFHSIGEDSFYFNTPCVLVKDKIIQKGKTYFIFHFPTNAGVKVVDVRLLDAVYKNQNVQLIFEDRQSKQQFIMDTCKNIDEVQCIWWLVDFDFIEDQVNYK
jgi:hypothetical protein